MSAPVNEGNIIVGAGQLYKLLKCNISDIDAVTDTITLSGTPATPALINGDTIRVYGTGDVAVDGIYTVDSLLADEVTVNEIIPVTTATTGYAIPYVRGRVSLGGTEDGAEFTGSKEFYDVQGAEAPVTLRKELTQLTPTLTTGLLESTLDNLLLSWPGEESPIGTITIGDDGTVDEIGLSLVGKSPTGSDTRTYVFWRTVSTGDGGHRYTKGANTVISTEFECLPIWNDVDERWDFGQIIDA